MSKKKSPKGRKRQLNQDKKSRFGKYKLLCCVGLFLLYGAGCSFAWNAVSVYVFAYSGQPEEDRQRYDVLLSEGDVYEYDAAGLEAAGDEVIFKKDDWRLILVNKRYSIPEDYTFELGRVETLKGMMECDERIIPDWLKMKEAAKEDGINLEITSPYRDMDYQAYLFNRKIRPYMKEGMTYMEAYAAAAQAVTVPGASEHEIGLALDIVCDTYKKLEREFEDTAAGKWLAEHSYEYGFILRYPLGKEYVTGIQYEPWHFRYVGVEAATYITKEGLTLEEFVESLED